MIAASFAILSIGRMVHDSWPYNLWNKWFKFALRLYMFLFREKFNLGQSLSCFLLLFQFLVLISWGWLIWDCINICFYGPWQWLLTTIVCWSSLRCLIKKSLFWLRIIILDALILSIQRLDALILSKQRLDALIHIELLNDRGWRLWFLCHPK